MPPPPGRKRPVPSTVLATAAAKAEKIVAVPALGSRPFSAPPPPAEGGPRNAIAWPPLQRPPLLKNLNAATNGEIELFRGRNFGVVILAGVPLQTVLQMLDAKIAARYHIFEPDPQLYQDMARRMRNRPEVVLNPVGLSNSPGTIPFWRGSKTCFAGSGVNTPIRAETVDQYCSRNGIQKIDLLKLNTGGWEVNILAGLSKTAVDYLDIGYGPGPASIRAIAAAAQAKGLTEIGELMPDGKLLRRESAHQLPEDHQFTRYCFAAPVTAPPPPPKTPEPAAS